MSVTPPVRESRPVGATNRIGVGQEGLAPAATSSAQAVAKRTAIVIRYRESNGWAASAVAVVAATAAMAAGATAMRASLSRSARRPTLSLSYVTAYCHSTRCTPPARF